MFCFWCVWLNCGHIIQWANFSSGCESASSPRQHTPTMNIQITHEKGKPKTKASKPGLDVLFVIDASGSMYSNDKLKTAIAGIIIIWIIS